MIACAQQNASWIDVLEIQILACVVDFVSTVFCMGLPDIRFLRVYLDPEIDSCCCRTVAELLQLRQKTTSGYTVSSNTPICNNTLESLSAAGRQPVVHGMGWNKA